jgi:uncharacterized protein YdeI (YjbR/CyaY-like superfamily)
VDITRTLYVASRREWRRWLAENHAAAREIWLVFYKKAAGRASIPYDAAVEEALCFGWIDGVIKKMDGERYARRFTPRRRGSTLSAVNRRRVKELTARRKMTAAGRAALAGAVKSAREAAGPAPTAAPADLQKALAADEQARAFFERLAPSHRRNYVGWITSAKRAETRARRVAEAVRLLKKGTKALMK